MYVFPEFTESGQQDRLRDVLWDHQGEWIACGESLKMHRGQHTVAVTNSKDRYNEAFSSQPAADLQLL
jgi:hypothetical protein